MAERIGIVGAGITGATIARYLAERGWTVQVFDGRDHVAGNCHTVWHDTAACFHHIYGPHIFHTNNAPVIDWISRFCTLDPYRHTVKARYRDRVYSLPINLHTINHFFGRAMTPDEARAFITANADTSIDPDANFETRALSLIGRELYQAFFEGYTIKPWGTSPRNIPASILKRLPVRFNYDDNYFFHTFQGEPADGYTAMVAAMLDHANIQVLLGSEVVFSDVQDDFAHIFWSGAIEDVFLADEGTLPYRTLDFDTSVKDGDFQGCAVMNYADPDVPYTRITQHNYFRNSAITHHEIKNSLVSVEYSRDWTPGDIRFYPVHHSGENALLSRYQTRAREIEKLTLCGRLGAFQYMDMDVAMAAALEIAKDFAG